MQFHANVDILTDSNGGAATTVGNIQQRIEYGSSSAAAAAAAAGGTSRTAEAINGRDTAASSPLFKDILAKVRRKSYFYE